MVKSYTFTINQFWPFFFDRCVQFVQLTAADIRINRLFPWKQLKNYHTFPIPPNRQHNILFMMPFSFRCCLWWFITLGPRSFSNHVMINNPFFITSDNSVQKRIEFIAQLHDDLIRLWLWFGRHQLYLADLNVSHLWVKNPQNGIYQTNFDTFCLLRLPHHTHHVTF